MTLCKEARPSLRIDLPCPNILELKNELIFDFTDFIFLLSSIHKYFSSKILTFFKMYHDKIRVSCFFL